MPLKTNDLISTPFADKGDKRQIPEQAQPNGEVSLEQGFTDKYQINPQAGGFYLQRDHFNQLFNEITQSIQNLQIQGGRPFDRAILNGDGYPLGAKCLVYSNIVTGEIVENPQGAPYEFITMTIISMIDNNKTDPFAGNKEAFYNDWFVDDGIPIGHGKISFIPQVGQIGKTPLGYLEVANNNPNQTYQFAQFKRVKALFDKAGGANHIGLLKLNGATGFQLADYRGLALRIWSNGGNIDAGRNFNDIQMDGAPNIVGRINALVGERFSGSGVFTTATRGAQGASTGGGRGLFDFDANASRSSNKYGASPNEIRMANCNIRLFVKI